MNKLKIKHCFVFTALLTVMAISSCSNEGPPRVIETDQVNPEALLLSSTSLPDGINTGLYVSDYIAYLFSIGNSTGSLLLIDISDNESPVYLSQLNGLEPGLRLIPDGQFEPAGTPLPALSSTLIMPILGDGIITFDVSDAFAPSFDISPTTPTGIVFDIAVTDTFRCAANGEDVAIIVTSPFSLTLFPSTEFAVAIANDANYCYSLELAFTGTNPPQLRIFDPNDPGGIPVEIAAIDLEGSEIIVAGSYAYVLTENVGLTIVDISDPTLPGIISQVETPLATITRANAISIDDVLKRAYIATDIGIIIIDISDPFFPVEIGSFELFNNSPLAVSANNGILYVVTVDITEFNPPQLFIIDVSQF